MNRLNKIFFHLSRTSINFVFIALILGIVSKSSYAQSMRFFTKIWLSNIQEIEYMKSQKICNYLSNDKGCQRIALNEICRKKHLFNAFWQSDNQSKYGSCWRINRYENFF
jgi:hypothetical protein